MAKVQKRRSISVRPDIYTKIGERAALFSTSISSLVEALIDKHLADPAITPPKLYAQPPREERAEPVKRRVPPPGTNVPAPRRTPLEHRPGPGRPSAQAADKYLRRDIVIRDGANAPEKSGRTASVQRPIASRTSTSVRTDF